MIINSLEKSQQRTAKRQLEYFRLNTKKHINLSAPIEKEIKVFEKNSRNIIDKKINCKLKFIESGRFISELLSNLDHNLAEKINEDKCKNCLDNCLKCMEEN